MLLHFLHSLHPCNSAIAETSCGKRTRVDRLFYLLKPGEVLTIPRRQLGRHRVFLSGLRLGDGELWIVAGDPFEPEAIRIYGLRREIETLLGCLKGRGFKLEETRGVGYLRIKKLLLPYLIKHR